MSYDEPVIDDCCCEDDATDWSSETVDDSTSFAPEDDYVEDVVTYDDDPVVPEPAEAVAEAEPTISATWGAGVESEPAPAVEQPVATIGGDVSPGFVIEPAPAVSAPGPAAEAWTPTTAFVGGGTGPGFEIVAPQPMAAPDLNAALLGGTNLGGDTFGVGIDVANDQALAQFAHDSGLDQVAPAAPRPMTADEQLAAGILLPGLQHQLAQDQRNLQDTMSPLYHAGDDIDPDSIFYNGRS